MMRMIKWNDVKEAVKNEDVEDVETLQSVVKDAVGVVDDLMQKRLPGDAKTDIRRLVYMLHTKICKEDES